MTYSSVIPSGALNPASRLPLGRDAVDATQTKPSIYPLSPWANCPFAFSACRFPDQAYSNQGSARGGCLRQTESYHENCDERLKVLKMTNPVAVGSRKGRRQCYMTANGETSLLLGGSCQVHTRSKCCDLWKVAGTRDQRGELGDWVV